MKKFNMSKQLRDSLKISLKDWILDSTSHGFPKIFKTDRLVLKIVWTFCLCISIGLCAYMIATAVLGYFQYDVTTIIRQKTEIPIDLPAISICQREMFMTQKAVEFMQQIMRKIGIDDVTNATFFSNFFKSDYQQKLNIIMLNYLGRLYALEYNMNDEIRKSFGFEIDDFLISCFKSTAACKKEDFVWYFDNIYGNCYILNSGKFQNGSSNTIYQQSNTGFFYGINMELFNQMKFVEDYINYKGFHITLFDQKSRVNSVHGLDVASKFQTNIIVRKKVIKKIPKPYSECEDDHSDYKSSEVYQATIKLAESYSREICIGMCYQDYLIPKCKCSDPFQPYYKNITNCLALDQVFCDFTVFNEFFNKLDVQEVCSKHCPLECERTVYEFSTSFAEYPSNLQAKASTFLMNTRNSSFNYTEDEIKKNSLQINIYYDQLESETIEEMKKMEVVDLVSNIGGILGLFIGISILSFAELIEICIEIIFVLFEVNKKSKVIQVQSEQKQKIPA